MLQNYITLPSMYSYLLGLEPKERLSKQQKLLRKRLGLDIAPGIDVGMDKLFDDEDLLVNPHEVKGKSLIKQKSFEVCIKFVITFMYTGQCIISIINNYLLKAK